MIFIKERFTVEEAAVTRAKNPGCKLVDKNNFNMMSFKGKQVAKVGKSKLTDYLFNKAVELGASAESSDVKAHA
jgi:hypothetical protein